MAEPVRQSTFTGGLISPEAYGRADLGKYQAGVRRLDNMLVLPHGPVHNRAGAAFCGMTRNIDWPYSQGDAEYTFSPVKLFSWEYSEDDTYLAAVGEKHIRFLRNGSPLLEAGIDVSTMTTHTPMRVNTTVLNYFQHMDLVYFAGCEGRTMFNDRFWYVHTYQDTITIATVAAGNPTTVVTTAAHGWWTGSPTTEDVYIDDCVTTLGTPHAGGSISKQKLVLTTVDATTFTVPVDTSGEDDSTGGWCCIQMTPRTVDNTFRVSDQFGNLIDGNGMPAYTGNGKVYRVVEVRRHRMLDEQDIEYDRDDVARINAAQSADIMPMVHRGYASRKLIRNTDTDWSIEKVTWGATHDQPGGLVDISTTSGTDVTWYVTAIDAENGEESLPSTVQTANPEGNEIAIRWNKVAGSSGYHVYRNDTTLRRAGFVGLLEHDNELDPATYSFIDPEGDTIEPNFDLGPPENRADLFGDDGENTNPGVILWHEQRLFVGSTTLQPTRVWGSGRGVYWNHNVSVPPVPDDPVAFAVAALKENYLHNLISMKDLVLVTTASEFRVNGGGDEMIEPARIQSRPQTTRGSNFLQALMIDDSALVVTGTGNAVANVFYSYENDGYRGQDLSILAQSLFRGKTIVSWDYAKYPYSAVWLVLSDGTAACMCYHREHKVWGWSSHSTPNGKIESVAAVREGTEHAVYFAVRRIVNGNVVRYIERLHERSYHDFDGVADARRGFFLDSGLSYNPVVFPDEPDAEPAATFAIESGYATWTFSATWDPSAYLAVDDYVDVEGFQGSGNADPAVYPDQEYPFPQSFNRRQFQIRTVSGAPNYKITLKTLDGDALDEDMCKNWVQTRHGVFRIGEDTISRGLDHLIGEDNVYALRNGAVDGPLTILEDATYDNLAQPYVFERPASFLHIGKVYVSRFETLDAESDKLIIGHRKQALASASILVRESRGHWWGPDWDHLVEFPDRDIEPYDIAPYLHTGWRSADDLVQEHEWKHSRLCVEQRDPLPLEIQAVVREIELGE